jgi:putative membrane protein
MTLPADPRVYFAAERTLLAWVRTGLGVIALGFLMARFGMFLRVLRPGTPGGQLGSAVFGVAFVILGTVITALAAWQHVRFCRGLSAMECPRNYSPYMSTGLAITLSVAGFALAVFLTVREIQWFAME